MSATHVYPSSLRRAPFTHEVSLPHPSLASCVFFCSAQSIDREKQTRKTNKKTNLQCCQLHCGCRIYKIKNQILKTDNITAECVKPVCLCKVTGMWRLFLDVTSVFSSSFSQRSGVTFPLTVELSFSLPGLFLLLCFFGSQAVTASFRKLLRQSVCCLFLSKV